MTSKPEIQYRIGDFARHMGVTTNFLKHYEEQGLLKSNQTCSGYRYFGFHQSARILDYIRMRNCGIPIKDIRSMLTMHGSESIELMEHSLEELRKRVEFETAVLEEHERFKTWYAERLERPIDWEVRQIEEQYFLPHTNRQDFIKDDRIIELLQAWTSWMPIVKSGMLIDPAGEPGHLPQEWGLIVRASRAKRHGLPLNSIVKTVPAGKAFIYHFAGDGHPGSMEEIADQSHPLYMQMRKLGLEPAGKVFMIIDMKYSDEDSNFRSTYGRFLVPIK